MEEAARQSGLDDGNAASPRSRRIGRLSVQWREGRGLGAGLSAGLSAGLQAVWRPSMAIAIFAASAGLAAYAESPSGARDEIVTLSGGWRGAPASEPAAGPVDRPVPVASPDHGAPGVGIAAGLTGAAPPAADAPPPVNIDEVALMEADSFEDDHGPPRRVIAHGDVLVRYQGRTLRADEVVYDTDNRQVYAKGKVELHNNDGSVEFADEVQVDDRLEKGVAAGFSARLAHDTTVVAAFAQRDNEQFNRLEHARYTACKLCKGKAPTWALRARRATQDFDDQLIKYRDTVVEVKGLPVLYLPYFFHPDPTASRKSGFLFPEIAVTSARGFTFGLPYFWAANPSTDVTITPRIFSRVNPVLQAGVVRRFYSGGVEVEGSGTYEREFDQNGLKFGDDRFRGALFADGRFRVSNHWNWGFAAERVSDDLYLDRYAQTGVGYVQRGLYYVESRRLDSQVYVQRQTERSYFETTADFFQNLRGAGLNGTVPVVGPSLIGAWRLPDPILNGRFNLTVSGLSLERPAGVDLQRGSFSLDWRTSTVLPGGLVFEPYAFGRGDYYRIRNLNGRPDASFGRGLYLGGAEARLPFIRTGKTFDVLLEPVLAGYYGRRNANDPRIPVEDGQAFELDETSLLRPNAAPNFDLFQGGGRGTAALRTTVFGPGSLKITTFAGRQWRTAADQSFNAFSDLNGASSDYVGSAQIQFGSWISAFARTRLDKQSLGVRRLDVGGASRFWRLSFNGRYSDINRDPGATAIPSVRTREVLASGDLRLSKNWSIGYTQRRDLTNRFNALTSGRLTYQDSCTRLEVFFNQTQTAVAGFGGSTSFGFRLSLATLGDFNSGH